MKRTNAHIRNPGALRAIENGREDGVGAIICHCGKVSHPSRKSAKSHMKALRSVRPGYRGEVYKCRRGGIGWHVGESKLPLLRAFMVALREIAGL